MGKRFRTYERLERSSKKSLTSRGATRRGQKILALANLAGVIEVTAKRFPEEAHNARAEERRLLQTARWIHLELDDPDNAEHAASPGPPRCPLAFALPASISWSVRSFTGIPSTSPASPVSKGKGTTIPSHLLKHVSPISREHTNLTETYSWRTEPTDPTSFRPLREEKSF